VTEARAMSRFLKTGDDADLIRALNYVDGFDSIRGCEYAAYELFGEIERRHGLEQAYRIFTKFGMRPSARKLARIKNDSLLDRYDLMDGKQSVQRLAKEVAKDGSGPRGSSDVLTVDKHIRRLIKKRELRDGKIHRRLRAELEELRETFKKCRA